MASDSNSGRPKPFGSGGPAPQPQEETRGVGSQNQSEKMQGDNKGSRRIHAERCCNCKARTSKCSKKAGATIARAEASFEVEDAAALANELTSARALPAAPPGEPGTDTAAQATMELVAHLASEAAQKEEK